MKRKGSPGANPGTKTNANTILNSKGIKYCGVPKSLFFDYNCDQSPSAGWQETYACMGVRT